MLTETVVLHADGRKSVKFIDIKGYLPFPDQPLTIGQRVTALETSKANQEDVDELNEALNMILTGVTE